MARLLPVLIEMALLVICLIDAAQTPESGMRNLPKWAWIALIVIIPIAGPVAWLVAGRPRHQRGATVVSSPTRTAGFGEYERPRRTQLAPDDDPAFLAKLKRDNAHENLLRQWEQDLKRREEELRRGDESDPDGAP